MADDITIVVGVQDKGILTAIDKTNRLEANVRKLSKALDSGKITGSQFDAALNKMSNAAKSYGDQVQKYSVALRASKKAQEEAAAADQKAKVEAQQFANARKEATEANRQFDIQQKKAAIATQQAAAEQERLKNKFVQGYAASKNLTVATRDLGAALSLGIISAKQHKLQVAELGREYQRTGKYTTGFSAMQRMAGKSTNRFGMYSQQVGYQVGDMVVQIQGGTDALLAFGQQGTQLAGLLPGLAGAVIGIGLSLSTALGMAALKAKGLEIDFKGVINELKKPLKSLGPLLDGIASGFDFLGSTSKTVLTSLANNLDRVVLYVTVAASAFGAKLVGGLIAARLATLTLAGAFAFLRTAIIRTGIGAIIIAVAEAIRMFMLLSKQLGGVGPLLKLLKEAFFDVLGMIGNKILWLGLMAKASFWGIVKDSLEALSDLLSKVNSGFVNRFIGMFAGAIAAAAEYIKSLPDIFVAVFLLIKKTVADGVNSFTGVIGEGINGLRDKLGLAAIDFGDLIDTSGMTGGDVAGVLANTKASISSAYQKATAIDYVAAAQSKLTTAINEADKAQQGALKDAVSVDAALNKRSQAIDTLVDAYNNLPSGDAIDFDKMLKTADDDGGGKESQLAKLIEEQRQRAILLTMYGQERALQEEIFNIKNELGDEADKLSKKEIEALARVNLELEKQEKLYEERVNAIQGIYDTIEGSMESAFMSMVDGTKSAKDAFKSMAAEIIKELYRVLVVQRLVGSFDAKTKTGTGLVGMLMGAFQANGGAWSGGSQIQAYANGGVVGGPTFFPMAGGKTGLMGEAGPEAIMPLKRDKNGKLGVSVEGGSGSVVVNNNINVTGGSDPAAIRMEVAKLMPQITSATKSAVIDARRRGGQMKSAFS